MPVRSRDSFRETEKACVLSSNTPERERNRDILTRFHRRSALERLNRLVGVTGRRRIAEALNGFAIRANRFGFLSAPDQFLAGFDAGPGGEVGVVGIHQR